MEPTSAVILRGTTRLVGVIGRPIEHSLSPLMHNAAFAALDMDWAYVAFRVEPERVPEALRGIAALGLVGLNVTIPHKTAAAQLVDELDAAACALQSVNTIHHLDGRLKGYSTDGPGFVRAIEETGNKMGIYMIFETVFSIGGLGTIIALPASGQRIPLYYDPSFSLLIGGATRK